MNIVLLGAPSSGKGTMAQKLVEKFNFFHISTGELLRENISLRTQLGMVAQTYMEKGNLVPDELVCKLVEEKLRNLSKDVNVIFDGFPRSIVQAKMLDAICKIDKVVNLSCSDDVIKERTLGRRICSACKKIYNTRSYSSLSCQACGGELISRSDDTLETVTKRIEEYKRQTSPLIEYYKKQNKLIIVDASKDIDNFDFLFSKKGGKN